MKSLITKRKDGRWQGTIEVEFNQRKMRKYVYALTKLECEQRVVKAKEDLESRLVLQM